VSALWAVALLGARNSAEAVLPQRAYLPANVATGAALVALARRSGLGWGAIGLAPVTAGQGLRAGLLPALATAAGLAVGAALPETRRWFDDARVEVERGPGELWFQTLVRIPVGTVAFEEVAFRGVLLALLRRRLPARAALVTASALFGLWHVVPTLAMARANGITGRRRTVLVGASVAATTLAGTAFCALRRRAGHLLAPALLHLAFNDTGYVLAWQVRTRAASRA
jgi:membrane protease YdiL (CAAX protease family)